MNCWLQEFSASTESLVTIQLLTAASLAHLQMPQHKWTCTLILHGISVVLHDISSQCLWCINYCSYWTTFLLSPWYYLLLFALHPHDHSVTTAMQNQCVSGWFYYHVHLLCQCVVLRGFYLRSFDLCSGSPYLRFNISTVNIVFIETFVPWCSCIY